MSLSIQKVTKSDQKIALSSLGKLIETEAEIKRKKVKVVNLKIQESDEIVSIPFNALKLLKSIIGNMAEGKSIALMPTDAVISTQQGAEILNVSRPHLVKLLETGKIPFKKVGSHRRILLTDLLNYKSKSKAKRRKNLDLLAEEAQKLNLGY